MSTTDQDPGKTTLIDAEDKLLSAATTGTLVDLLTGTAGLDDPSQGMNWNSGRQVQAEWLIELLIGTQHPGSRTPRAIRLRGARITGSLNLEGASLTCPLLLEECYFDEPVILNQAIAPAVQLAGCHVPTLTAVEARITRSLWLNAGFTANAEVSLDGAQIGGQLSIVGASLANPGKVALSGEELTVEYDVFLSRSTVVGLVHLNKARIGGTLNLDGAKLSNPGDVAMSGVLLSADKGMSCGDGFTAKGEVQLKGAHIGGYLMMNGAKLNNRGMRALNADGLTVNQDMYCGDRFTAKGEIRLLDAHIGGQLSLNGARLINSGKDALTADNLTVGSGMHCQNGFTAKGKIRLAGAHIGGVLDLNGAKLINPGKDALTADQLTVGLSVHCHDGFTAKGKIRLPGAHIYGQLIMDGASLNNRKKTALFADRMVVDMDMSCSDGFTVAGGIELDGARIGGHLAFDKARLINARRTAISAHGLTVGNGVYCSQDFAATGAVVLVDASVGAGLDLTGAELTHADGVALDLEGAKTTTLRLPSERPDGAVNLTNAKVEVLADAPEGWPTVLLLRGFVYGSLESRDVSTRARLEWLKLHPGRFVPQLYDQLAETYRKNGDEAAARTVAVAKQWRRRRAYSPVNWLWYATVGYGYRTWLAAIWLVALVGLGTGIFSGAYPAHMTAISTSPPPFHAPVYALDILLPVIGLGQKAAWQPQGPFYLYWSWALTIAGWVLTTAVVAGLTGILKRD